DGDITCSYGLKGSDKRSESLFEVVALFRKSFHARDEATYFVNDTIELSHGAFEPFRGRRGDGSQFLLRRFQSHADSVQRLKDVVMEILADTSAFFHRLFALRDILDHGKKERAGVPRQFNTDGLHGHPNDVAEFSDVAFLK